MTKQSRRPQRAWQAWRIIKGSYRDIPAIDNHCVAQDERRLRRGQEQNTVRDFLHFSNALDGRSCHLAGRDFGPAGHVRIDESRADTVHPDPLSAIVDGAASRQGNDCGFGR